MGLGPAGIDEAGAVPQLLAVEPDPGHAQRHLLLRIGEPSGQPQAPSLLQPDRDRVRALRIHDEALQLEGRVEEVLRIQPEIESSGRGVHPVRARPVLDPGQAGETDRDVRRLQEEHGLDVSDGLAIGPGYRQHEPGELERPGSQHHAGLVLTLRHHEAPPVHLRPGLDAHGDQAGRDAPPLRAIADVARASPGPAFGSRDRPGAVRPRDGDPGLVADEYLEPVPVEHQPDVPRPDRALLHGIAREPVIQPESIGAGREAADPEAPVHSRDVPAIGQALRALQEADGSLLGVEGVHGQLVADGHIDGVDLHLPHRAAVGIDDDAGDLSGALEKQIGERGVPAGLDREGADAAGPHA